ncbi:peptide ABC transporter substrate-binding protein [Bacillus aquiflavi]|uniref:peptide ABC transporter substrate-binding protein n=1 Tax=Bacillus aquiflavi TaxID=2672567 RepID=UPI001CA90C7B|nr:peptide ABC transporter substrate-binding protein [Bacillus aquiflavi]UAC49090.1 peptide ABC transporter substrate-binding protein [Bacillus aquiflavi]
MKKRFSLLFSMLLVFSVFLAACGGGNADGDKADKKDKAKSNAEQELAININTEPPTLNPGLAKDSTSGAVLLQAFEGLTRINKDGKPEEAMAKKIDVSDDQLVYTFTLRDTKWSNGDPVTAQDFEYAWKWVLDPNNGAEYAYQLYYIKGAEAANLKGGSLDEVGIKALDDKTLEVTLENPTPFFTELTAFYTYYPVNKAIAENNPDWHTDAGENFTSNGPFKLVEWSHSDKVILKKNENYWDSDKVKHEKIEMFMINDANTELSMFDNGELDWAGKPNGQLPTDAMQALKDEGRLKIEPFAGIYWYKFNTKVEPLNNVNIRKALTYAIDRKSIINNITQTEEIPAMAIVPPTMFSENEKGYFKDNDVKKAKEYLQKGLEELGLKDASELPPISLSYNTLESHQKIAQAIQDMWKTELGIEVVLDNQEWAVYLDKIQSGDYQIGRLGWAADFNDPINFLEMFRDAAGGNNQTGWENEEFKNLLDESAKEKDPKKRAELLKKAEEIIIDELPVAPIYFNTTSWVQNDSLKGVVVSGLGDAQFKWAYFE